MVMGHEAIAIVRPRPRDVGAESRHPRRRQSGRRLRGVHLVSRRSSSTLCEQRRLYGCVPSLAGAFADEMVARVENLVPLDGPAAVASGALTEPFAVGAHAVRLGPEPNGKDVVVIGAGHRAGYRPLARRAGASSVLVVEPNGARRAVIERFGLGTHDPSRGPVDESSVSIAYECVGHSATVAAALFAIRPHGTVVFVGLAEEQIQIPATPLMVGERTSSAGSSTYTMTDFRDVAAWICSGEDVYLPGDPASSASTSSRRCSTATRMAVSTP